MAIPQKMADGKVLPFRSRGWAIRRVFAGLVVRFASDEAELATGANFSINGGQHLY